MFLAKILVLVVASTGFISFAYGNDDLKMRFLGDAGFCNKFLSANDNVSQTTPFPPLHHAFPYGRGLLDTNTPVTVENLIKSKTLGLMEWGVRIYPATSLDNALRKYNEGEYHEMSMQTWYLVLPPNHPWKPRTKKEYEENYKNLPDAEKAELTTWEYKKLIREGAKLVYLHKENISRKRIEQHAAKLKEQAEKEPNKRNAIEKFIKVYEEFLNNGPKAESYPYKSLPIDIVNRLPGDATEDKWMEVPTDVQAKVRSLENSFLEEGEGEFFFQSGWFLPEVRGVIYPEEFLNRSTSKDLQKFMRALFNKGYRVTFNQQPRMVIEEAGNQVRGHKESQGDTRFKEDLILAYEQMIRAGKAYSIELWHPTGMLVGGTFGMISNGTINAESVYYPNLKDPDVMALKDLFENDPRFAEYKKDPVITKSIDMAKVPVRLLLLLLQWHGYSFMDAEMVTPFTQSMSGKYVWLSDFNNMRANIAKHAKKTPLKFPKELGAPVSARFTPMKIKDFVKKNKK